MPVNSFDTYPMTWKPVISKELLANSRTIYTVLANQLEQDIRNGILLPGTKLPPQRELADYLDLNLSTITRAFKLCSSRGLLSSAVGKGTYVSSDIAKDVLPKRLQQEVDHAEFGIVIPNSDLNKSVLMAMQEMLNEPDIYKIMNYEFPENNAFIMEAAVRWLQETQVMATAETTLFANGGQNAIF